MKNILKNITSFIVGAVIGGLVNMGIIMISDSVIALPKGIGPSDMDSLVDNFHLFEPINFLMPFLANALGTLVGALSIGILFLL